MKTISKTTLEYWALIAEIAGAIAIVVSVIYLGVQIRADTKVLRSQAHYNALCSPSGHSRWRSRTKAWPI